jgi:hypothetical protein
MGALPPGAQASPLQYATLPAVDLLSQELIYTFYTMLLIFMFIFFYPFHLSFNPPFKTEI